MGENSKIEWTTHTFNPWRGCTRVSEGCRFCYAETLSKRNPAVFGVWGPKGTRVIASESAWKEPIKWDKAAAKAGERHRVFCASLADVFEDRSELEKPRARLWGLIESTPNLDWLLLTKRPENVLPLLRKIRRYNWPAMGGEYTADRWMADPLLGRNVWLGVSVEDQERADERIPHLLKTPAAVRFLSVEPLLSAVDLSRWVFRFHPWTNAGGPNECRHGYAAGIPCPDCTPRIHWVIVGGESGPKARPMCFDWAESIVRQCQAAAVSVFVKQLGARPYAELRDANNPGYRGAMECRYRDRKGGDPAEWPESLRVREFPIVKVSHA